MRYIILPFIALLFINNTMAQGRPQLVFDKTVSANFDKIKKGMNDLIKNFGKNPTTRYGSSYTDYEMNFKFGNAAVTLRDDVKNQSLSISFTGSYYKGTVADFEAFYEAIVTKVTEMLALTHTAQDEKRTSKIFALTFYETGKTWSESLTSVYLNCDLYMATNPLVKIEFYTKKR